MPVEHYSVPKVVPGDLVFTYKQPALNMCSYCVYSMRANMLFDRDERSLMFVMSVIDDTESVDMDLSARIALQSSLGMIILVEHGTNDTFIIPRRISVGHRWPALLWFDGQPCQR